MTVLTRMLLWRRRMMRNLVRLMRRLVLLRVIHIRRRLRRWRMMLRRRAHWDISGSFQQPRRRIRMNHLCVRLRGLLRCVERLRAMLIRRSRRWRRVHLVTRRWRRSRICEMRMLAAGLLGNDLLRRHVIEALGAGL